MQRAEQLQAADRTRRLLLADVSHELMTPLTGMRGYLETLSLHAQSLDPETRERYLSIIRDETQRVEHIVGDLLDLSRLEGGGESFDAQDVPLEDLFGRVVARHGRAAEQKGVEIATNIAPGAEIVTGDPMRLEQALQNLAANALRHTPKGGQVALNADARGRRDRRDRQRHRNGHRCPNICPTCSIGSTRWIRRARDTAAGSGLGFVDRESHRRAAWRFGDGVEPRREAARRSDSSFRRSGR